MPDTSWLVGCGTADITGEVWDAGMMGYGMRHQRSTGVHLRQWSRAFVLVDREADRRLAYVVADIGMFFANIRAAVLARLDPAVLRPEDVVLTATHTHAGPGGLSCYSLYGTTNGGLRQHTVDAVVDGVVASIERALADVAPGRLLLARGELHDASVNRSPQAFALDPAADRAHFPGGIDPATTVLRLEREGRLVGAIDWFATHGTSLTNRNTLVSGDNKGWAAVAAQARLGGVVAFAQTNAGDMSPNVPDGRRGPTPDEFENARIIGQRQADVAVELASGPGTELEGGLDTRLSYVDLAGLAVDAAYTPDGRPHRTGSAVLGAAFAAGTKEGPGLPWLHEGVDENRLVGAVSRAAYRLRPSLRDAQAPKAMLLPVGVARAVARRVPVQLVRIGPLVLVALAQEVTVVAGLRLRRVVAGVLSVPLEDVLVQGYANDYAGYVTTPEEYDAQRYEGGHTMFGRWLLPAYLQEVARVAADLRDGRASAGATPPQLRPGKRAAPAEPDPPAPPVLLRQPPSSCRPGDVVEVEVGGDDPRGRPRPSYAVVQRREGGDWVDVAADGDGSVTVRWRRVADLSWSTTISWTAAAAGEYRLCLVGRDGGKHPSTEVAVQPA